MPKNAKRVASRQAGLGNKKRKTSRRASVHNSTAVDTSYESVAPVEVVASKLKNPLAQKTAPSITVENSPNKPSYKSSHNPYIWPEIKRIMSVTALIFIMMAVLAIAIN